MKKKRKKKQTKKEIAEAIKVKCRILAVLLTDLTAEQIWKYHDYDNKWSHEEGPVVMELMRGVLEEHHNEFGETLITEETEAPIVVGNSMDMYLPIESIQDSLGELISAKGILWLERQLEELKNNTL